MKAATHFSKSWSGKPTERASTIRSIFFIALLTVSIGNLLACQFFGAKCKFCGASLSAGKVHNAEGFDVCHECDRHAVRDLRTAQALVAEVRKEIVSLGIRLPWGAIPIKLGPSAAAGVNARCEAARYANGTVASIWINFVQGMPKPMFKASAAHELTHAWAYLNRSPMQQDEALSEGAPTLVEYTYLEKNQSTYGDYRRNAIMTSNNKFYGKGTRRLQAYAKDHGGLTGVLTLLKTSQTIPEGF